MCVREIDQSDKSTRHNNKDDKKYTYTYIYIRRERERKKGRYRVINRGREEGKGSSFQPDCHVIIAHMPAAFYRRDRSMYDCDMIPDRQVCCISCFSISIFFFHVKKNAVVSL